MNIFHYIILCMLTFQIIGSNQKDLNARPVILKK